MQPSYIVFFLLLIIVLNQRNHRQITAERQIILKKRKRAGRKNEMFELAKTFIGKECFIYTLNAQITGVIKDVQEGALLLDNGKESEIINLDYITRIREYPRTKSGKKRSVVLD